MKKLIFFSLLVASSSLVRAQEDCIDPSLINPDAICSMLYAPVCGCDNVTYSNSCVAVNMGGVTSYTEGECDLVVIACDTLPNVDFGDCEMAMGWAFQNNACQAISGCGSIVNGIDYSSYFYPTEQACIMQCGGDSTFNPCIDVSIINWEVLCPAVYDPVCGCDGVTYSNSCEAVNYHGVTAYTPGECQSSQANCLDLGHIDFGLCDMYMGIAYINGSCVAMSGCGWIVDNIDYSPFFYENMDDCLSNCENHEQQCVDSTLINPTTGCFTIFAPVCGCNGITYGNSCEAFYQNGVTQWTNGECNPNSIQELETNSLVLYPNPVIDHLTVRVAEGTIVAYSIFDAAGKRIREEKISPSKQAVLPLHDLPTGFYSIQVMDSFKQFVRTSFVKS